VDCSLYGVIHRQALLTPPPLQVPEPLNAQCDDHSGHCNHLALLSSVLSRGRHSVLVVVVLNSILIGIEADWSGDPSPTLGDYITIYGHINLDSTPLLDWSGDPSPTLGLLHRNRPDCYPGAPTNAAFLANMYRSSPPFSPYRESGSRCLIIAHMSIYGNNHSLLPL
jgi:hypothetical protein